MEGESQVLPENLVFNNRNLFSNHYLLNLIQSSPEWKKKEHVEAFNSIKRVYTSQSAFFDGLKESQLEERFYTIIFKKILPCYEVQESSGSDSPDYAFFAAQETIDDAHKSADSKSFFTGALAIGEVKRWDVELDRFGKDRQDKRRNPSFQMWLYLNETGVNWGILSNGRHWRLYRKDKPLDVYYEVDLVSLLKNNDLEGFKYYYYFFRREAFLPNEEGEVFVETVLKGSADYAKEIGDNLKENVYRAMKKIAEGFFSWPENQLDYNDPKTRELVQKNTMILLYRLLFLLYAEGKGLLDLRNESYRDSHSFDKIKKEVASKKDGPAQHYYMPTSTSLWGSLKSLFRLIDKGSQELKIDHIIHIPAYNGGLFEPEENRQLDKWTIGDSFLADAVDLLSRSGVGEGGIGFVDYSTLEIRHLGSIYEGLLEYKVMVAESDLVVAGSEKERRWATLEEYNQAKSKKKAFEEFEEFDRARKGELYLTTDKGERKATGSYYTPDYIVNYIVANTIGPVVEERWSAAEGSKSSYVNATLSVKVLDPAMGSGHFLVGAVEFLAVKLMAAAQHDIEAGLAEDDGQFTNDWAKREAVSHCVYGVDLNDMAVELAKVSLWLDTISKDKPLSFLDHRLKKGNSLIGARLSDLKNYPGGKSRDENQTSLPSFVSPLFIKNLIGKIRELEGIEEDTLSDIKRKEKVFEEFKGLPQYTKAKAIANVHTSLYFGNQIEPTKNKDAEMVYHDMFWGVAGDEAEWKRKTWGQWFKQAQEMADQRAFFHWELEFPEIFFEEGTVKQTAGWDAVIGNPPYDVLAEKERQEDLSSFMTFIESNKDLFPAQGRKIDLFRLMVAKSGSLVCPEATIGLIIPMSILADQQTANLRKYLINNFSIKSIDAFPQKDDPTRRVFPEAKLPTCVVLFKNSRKEINSFVVVNHPGRYLNEISGRYLCEESIPKMLDEEYLPIPLLASDLAANLIKKLYSASERRCRIGDSIKTYQGEINETGLAQLLSTDPVVGPKVFRGGNIQRYEFLDEAKQGTDKYIDVQRYAQQVHGEKVAHTRAQRIGYQRNAALDDWRRLIFARLPSPSYCFDSISYFPILEGEKELTLLALLNSQLLEWRFRLTSTNNHVSTREIASLPAIHFNSNTPEPERARLVAELKALYQAGKFEEILASVEACLPKDAEGNFITAWERADVVHDLLAFLAEQMLEMNKQKQQEIKGFLSWLETEIGAKVEDLTPKTKVQDYYKRQFDEMLAILKKNKRKLKDFNPSGRDNQEDLRREFDASVGKLQPLMGRIKDTDTLIDQIVYRLYGLTEEEIKIVEGAI